MRRSPHFGLVGFVSTDIAVKIVLFHNELIELSGRSSLSDFEQSFHFHSLFSAQGIFAHVHTRSEGGHTDKGIRGKAKFKSASVLDTYNAFEVHCKNSRATFVLLGSMY